VKKAYRMLESGSLPEQVKKQYEEAQKKRFQISRYVKDREKKAEKAAKIEVARKMLARKRPLNEIAEDTGLSKEEIKSIK
jgi:predicted transposase/invertase (TIGR01784 family)